MIRHNGIECLLPSAQVPLVILLSRACPAVRNQASIEMNSILTTFFELCAGAQLTGASGKLWAHVPSYKLHCRSRHDAEERDVL